ncbi:MULTISPECIES: PEP-CTERM sorting domain-containing protein [unclassified Methylophilus]|uniref:PEP-CTERM sorting domain-containing protein n=1 Tax=unclassified Methylophilus TaxID=2630143 RepID=UPI000A787549|nr:MULTISPECIES: PEP-CTERM sorting domain-containing protein [unclassified Methylophilus]
MKLNSWAMTGMLVMAALSPATQAAELIQNGGFESHGADVYDITGWQVAEQGFFGSVLAQTGTSTEVTANNTVGAYQGSYYGILDNYGNASNALFQTFNTGAVSSATLSFQMFVNNQNSTTNIDAAGLDYSVDATDNPNQHVRVDILKAGADPFSINSADVVQSLYIGGANGVLAANNYVNYSFDLSASLASGGSYILRFATVANQNSLQLGVDNISLNTVSAVPEADSVAMLLAGLGLMAGVKRRRKD